LGGGGGGGGGSSLRKGAIRGEKAKELGPKSDLGVTQGTTPVLKEDLQTDRKVLLDKSIKNPFLGGNDFEEGGPIQGESGLKRRLEKEAQAIAGGVGEAPTGGAKGDPFARVLYRKRDWLFDGRVRGQASISSAWHRAETEEFAPPAKKALDTGSFWFQRLLRLRRPRTGKFPDEPYL